MFNLEPTETKWDLRWRMLGVPVRVSIWFWISTLLLHSSHDFEIKRLLVWVACVFSSIMVHEFGHALTARFSGSRSVRVVLYHLGGLAIGATGLTRRQRMLMIFMGPGAGFILYGIIHGGSLLVDYATLPRYARIAIADLKLLNLVWGLVNLLPMFPLDGGQLAREVFEARNAAKGLRQTLVLSLYTAATASGAFVMVLLLQGLKVYQFSWLPIQPSILLVLFFAGLAYLNWHLSRPQTLEAHYENAVIRRSWEQDPDWWKK